MACAPGVDIVLYVFVWWILATYSLTVFGLFSFVVKNYMYVVVSDVGTTDWWTHLRHKSGSWAMWALPVYVLMNVLVALSVAVAGISIMDSYTCVVLGTATVSVTQFYWIVILLAAGLILYKLWYTWTFTGYYYALVAGAFFGFVALACFVGATILIGISGANTSWDKHYIVALTFGIFASLVTLIMWIITLVVIVAYRKHIVCNKKARIVIHPSMSDYNFFTVKRLANEMELNWKETYSNEGSLKLKRGERERERS